MHPLARVAHHQIVMQNYHMFRRVGSVSILNSGGQDAFSKGYHERFMRDYRDVKPKKAPLPPGITPEMAEWAQNKPKQEWQGSFEERVEAWAKWLRLKARLERRCYAHMALVWRGMRRFRHNVPAEQPSLSSVALQPVVPPRPDWR